MLEASGNIWDWIAKGHRIVIPTNRGWRTDGKNVMGAGLAAQALYRYPGIDQWYGDWCRNNMYQSGCVPHPQHPLIFFPTKTLNLRAPHLSWRNSSDLLTIHRSLQKLGHCSGLIALPLVGCGNGGLNPDDVLPVLRSMLADDRFTLVKPPWLT